MGRRRRRVRPPQASYAAQKGEGDQRLRYPQQDHCTQLRQQRAKRLLRQPFPALEANSQQEEHRQGVIEGWRKLELRTDQTCHQAEQEKQDDDVNHGKAPPFCIERR